MSNDNIAVVYSWTAHEGKANDLKGIYEQVSKQMEETEPGAKRVSVFYDESKSKLVVYDLFANAEALGFHLGVTAAAHFGDLLQIATPGPFLFCGEVPEDMKQAAVDMGLDATFAPYQYGFARS